MAAAVVVEAIEAVEEVVVETIVIVAVWSLETAFDVELISDNSDNTDNELELFAFEFEFAMETELTLVLILTFEDLALV